MSIGDLTNQMKSLQSSTTLELSEAVMNLYIARIATFRDALKTEQGKLKDLFIVENVGGVQSAGQLRDELNLNINDSAQGIWYKLQAYINYLDEFENTVKAAAGKLLAEG